MKKRIVKICVCCCLLLCIVALFAACDKKGAGDKATHPIKIAVLSDLHVLSGADWDDQELQEYAQTKKHLLPLSEALVKAQVDVLIEDKPDVVLITGDLTEKGDAESFQFVADQCARMEQAGISVFVTGGTYDFRYMASDRTDCTEKEAGRFVNYFAEYGYNEAISRDEEALSYVAELSDRYRLLVIDTASLTDYSLEKWNKTPPSVSNGLLTYIDENLDKALEDKKEMLVMSYFPINNEIGDHFGKRSKSLVVALDRHSEIDELLSYYYATTVFSGHMHALNTLVYSDECNDVIDYTASSACMYPLITRTYTETEEDGFIVTEKQLTSIPAEYIPDSFSKEEKERIQTDLLTYAKEHITDNVEYRIQTRMNENGEQYGFFLSLLRLGKFYQTSGLTPEQNEKGYNLGKDLYDVFFEMLEKPLYGENSLDSICQRFGKKMPVLPFENTLEFIGNCLCDVCADDIHLTSGSDEMLLMRYYIYCTIYRAAELDMFDTLHEIYDSVNTCDLRPVAERLFEDNKFDLTINDLLANIVTILNPYLQEYIGIALQFSTQQLLEILDMLLPFMIGAIFQEDYDETSGEIFGMDLGKYIAIEEGIVYFDELLDYLLLDVIGSDLFA